LIGIVIVSNLQATLLDLTDVHCPGV